MQIGLVNIFSGPMVNESWELGEWLSGVSVRPRWAELHRKS